MDGNLSQLIRQYRGDYCYIQIASAADRHEPENYPWLFNLLDEIGCNGWLGCEYIPRGDPGGAEVVFPLGGNQQLNWLMPCCGERPGAQSPTAGVCPAVG